MPAAHSSPPLALSAPAALPFLPAWGRSCPMIIRELRGIRTGIRSGIRSAIHSGIHSGIHRGVHSGIHGGIHGGIHSGIQSGNPSRAIRSHPLPSHPILSQTATVNHARVGRAVELGAGCRTGFAAASERRFTLTGPGGAAIPPPKLRLTLSAAVFLFSQVVSPYGR